MPFTSLKRVPVFRQLLADFETPLSIYHKLANRPYSYLFESVQGGEQWGRYSIIGLPCTKRLEVRGHNVCVLEDNRIVFEKEVDDPLDFIRQYHAQFEVNVVKQLPRMTGGLVGYFGFDTVALIEPKLGKNQTKDQVDAPDILLMISEEVVVFDNLSSTLHIIVHADGQMADGVAAAEQRLDEIQQQIYLSCEFPRSLPHSEFNKTDKSTAKEDDIHYSFPQDAFLNAVETCKDYIYEGDAFQIVISQCMAVPFSGNPLDLYRALRTLNPSPYLYYLDLGDFHIAGSSPEVLVRVENGVITLRPIAGTRHRGETMEQDNALAADLLSDEKELAEHLMLIDLGRNDVGRVSETGSVEVNEKMVIERYSHVMHIVSNVQGNLKPGLDAIDVFKATFPAGTLSGAPKVRAMEIIEELEPQKRGIYSGAIGYLSWDGNMDTAIAIRTAVIKNDIAYIQAGAGIVADSVAQNEWQETVNKGKGTLKSVEMAKRGLDTPLSEI